MNGFFGPSSDFQRFLYRYEEASRILGVNPLARQVFRTLLFDHSQEWNITQLADRFGHSRPTVGDLINRNISGGYLSRGEHNKLSVTDEGSRVLEWVHEETCEIALGHQAGFSEELIRLFRELDIPEVSPQASTIRFQNDLNIF